MSGPSPWIDEDGAREHPYCWRTAYVDRDNNRYGPIRDMVDSAGRGEQASFEGAASLHCPADLRQPEIQGERRGEQEAARAI